MKKITLLLATILATVAVEAQTTFDLDWMVGVNGGAASFTLEVGDAVHWTWADELPHSVTSIAGSTESFDSGILTGSGNEFTYTFTMEGSNDYECLVHPGTMFGTITVEPVLAVEDKFAQNISWFPNPVTDALTVTSLFELDSYVIHDILGNTVELGRDASNVLNINTAGLQTGMYFVTLVSGDLSTTIKILKQ